MAAKIDIRRGDTMPLEYIIKEDGVVVDITGYTFYFTIKSDRNAIDLNDNNGLVTIDVTSHVEPLAGRTIINLLPEHTQDITPGTYFYDLQMRDTGGTVTTLVADKCKILADVTQRTA